jgi:hypothetical protein
MPGRGRCLGSASGTRNRHTTWDQARRRAGRAQLGRALPEDGVEPTRTRDRRDGQAPHRPARRPERAAASLPRSPGASRGLGADSTLAQPRPRWGPGGSTRAPARLQTRAGPGHTTGVQPPTRWPSTTHTPHGPRQGRPRPLPRAGTPARGATWGGRPLPRQPPAIQEQGWRPDRRRRAASVARRRHHPGAGGGSKAPLPRHPGRPRADLPQKGRREQPRGRPSRRARTRTSLPLCQRWHRDGHDQRPTVRKTRRRESRVPCTGHARCGGGLGEKAARTSLVAYPTWLPGAPDA